LRLERLAARDADGRARHACRRSRACARVRADQRWRSTALCMYRPRDAETYAAVVTVQTLVCAAAPTTVGPPPTITRHGTATSCAVQPSPCHGSSTVG
jgi:hypothetical protein